MISLNELTKTYGRGADSVTVLDRLNFEVGAGEIFAVTGPSGAGKSTLAQCINLLERPTSGSVVVNGEDLSSLPEKRLRAARRRIGTVFQSASLLSRRTASENIALPLEYLGVTPGEIRARVGELIDRVGLGPKAHSYPFQLSGGQAQRVGIARALALRPAILLADEATSGLDPDTTSSVVELLKQLRTDLDLTVVFITHEMDTVRQIADSVARLERGRIVETGALVDLLTDHGSPLGRALQPRLRFAAADDDAATWYVTYDSADVPGDWIQRVSVDLAVPVHLLGASVETVHGINTGSATLGIAAASDDAVRAVLAKYGLSGTPDASRETGVGGAPVSPVRSGAVPALEGAA
ncbi:ATP-binding cassette domain-containing protein [Arthrobacter crusticola]|uniref:ATP-binding cassette domain-containing protein n=1 Tax=Arthrobacter crusticola TaxID=2547960 RepID=A0A4R5TZB1_9MICC|nr:ATP-binding cassette domain-containing protein [Arthrobacter crusticola]TDK26563.1 ATP-binding cassette domain-containing protein [Arthrobacter crusticola]